MECTLLNIIPLDPQLNDLVEVIIMELIRTVQGISSVSFLSVSSISPNALLPANTLYVYFFPSLSLNEPRPSSNLCCSWTWNLVLWCLKMWLDKLWQKVIDCLPLTTLMKLVSSEFLFPLWQSVSDPFFPWVSLGSGCSLFMLASSLLADWIFLENKALWASFILWWLSHLVLIEAWAIEIDYPIVFHCESWIDAVENHLSA